MERWLAFWRRRISAWWARLRAEAEFATNVSDSGPELKGAVICRPVPVLSILAHLEDVASGPAGRADGSFTELCAGQACAAGNPNLRSTTR